MLGYVFYESVQMCKNYATHQIKTLFNDSERLHFQIVLASNSTGTHWMSKGRIIQEMHFPKDALS